MCFERIRMHTGSMLMYLNRMQTRSENMPLHFASLHVYFESLRMLLKAYECNLKAYEYILRPYEWILNVYNYRYISSFDVIRTHNAVMAFHTRLLF